MDRITLVKLTRENVDLAGKVQNEIFPYSASYCKYLEEINNPNCIYYDYLIELKNTAIGVIGYYSEPSEESTAWLSWFGLLKEYRNKGYGKLAFDLLIQKLKQKGFFTLRLFTYKVWNKEAQSFYIKNMDFSESYTNDMDNQYDIINGKPLIFTKSLNSKPSHKWNNKFINLDAEDKLHEESLKLLKQKNTD